MSKYDIRTLFMTFRLNKNEKERQVLPYNEMGGNLKSPKKEMQVEEPWEDRERGQEEGT